MERTKFIFYRDWWEALRQMPDDMSRAVIEAIMNYALYGEDTTDPAIAYSIFSLVKAQIDRDTAKYEQIISRNRENGRKGGRPKRNDSENPENPKTQNNPKNPVGYLGYEGEETDRNTDSENPEKPKKPSGGQKTQKTQWGPKNPTEPKKANNNNIDNNINIDNDNNIINSENNINNINNIDDNNKLNNNIDIEKNKELIIINPINLNEEKKEKLEKEKKEAKTRFCAPSVDEVAAYLQEKGWLDVDAERFVAYYESNGWKVGRNPMKSWKAACLTWHKQSATQQTQMNHGNYYSPQAVHELERQQRLKVYADHLAEKLKDL